MSDDVAPARKRILRETWRQEKAVVFARNAIVGPHKFVAHDRSGAKSDKEHLWQWKRGVRKAIPDTQLMLPGGRHVWFEFKAPGQTPDDDQLRMLAELCALGDAASWGVEINDLLEFWIRSGVPLVPNAHYQALHYDGLVDSRIAKAEARTVPAKKSRTRPQPRFTLGKRAYRGANAKGII